MRSVSRYAAGLARADARIGTVRTVSQSRQRPAGESCWRVFQRKQVGRFLRSVRRGFSPVAPPLRVFTIWLVKSSRILDRRSRLVPKLAALCPANVEIAAFTAGCSIPDIPCHPPHPLSSSAPAAISIWLRLHPPAVQFDGIDIHSLLASSFEGHRQIVTTQQIEPV